MISSKNDLFLLIQNNYEIIFAIISIGVAVFLLKRMKTNTRRNGEIPGNLGLPFIGETFSFLSAAKSSEGCYEFIRLRRLRYGKWFKTRIFGEIHVFVPTTEGAKAILYNETAKFGKVLVKSMEDCCGKKSLPCVVQENHRRLRHLLSDPFSMTSLRKYVQQFDKMLCERLTKLEGEGSSFVVYKFNQKIAGDSMCQMLMSINDPSILQQIDSDIKIVKDSLISFPMMIPGTRYYKGQKARERIMKIFKGMISRRRSGEESHEDFLQSMLERDSYPANEKLDDSEIMDNLLTFFIAGQSTVAATMMWAVKFLDENKEIQEKLREEQVTVLKTKPHGYILTLEDLKNMEYATKVVKETQRLANAVLWIPRVALEDCILDGFEIKKGWNVNIDAIHIHSDPDLYPDPLKFDPSRFDETLRPYSYLPFGSGPRLCVGLNMAKVMMMVFLHRLVSGYKWSVDDPDLTLATNTDSPVLESGCPITLTALRHEN